MNALRYVGAADSTRYNERLLAPGEVVEMEDADAIAAADSGLFELLQTSAIQAANPEKEK